MRHLKCSLIALGVLMCLLLSVPQHSRAAAGSEELDLDLLADGVASWLEVDMNETVRARLELRAVSEHCGFVNDVAWRDPAGVDLAKETFDRYLAYLDALPGVQPAVTEDRYPDLRTAILLMLYAYTDGVEAEIRRQLQNDGIDQKAYCAEMRQFASEQQLFRTA